LIEAQKELAAAGKKKREITVNIVPDEILAEAKALAGDRFVPALLTPGKLAREVGGQARSRTKSARSSSEKFGAEKVTDFVIKDAFYYIQKEAVRKLILESGKRLDGRGLTPCARFPAKSASCRARTARRFSPAAKRRRSRWPRSAPATTRRNLIPTPAARPRRNSSCITTSRISPSAKPAASAARAAAKSATARWRNAPSKPMVPKDYPYAIRVTSEIMESNGSTSMASVCGGTLALMDAGVPLIRPVAGISIGICTDHDDGDKISKYKLLTDIIGWEDALLRHGLQNRRHGKGHHRFQLDLKLKGIPHALMAETVETRAGRAFAHAGGNGQDARRTAQGIEQVRPAHQSS
jgi:polyribonucleotide nucleotidyltransferase